MYDPTTGAIFEVAEEEFPGENSYRFENTYFIRYSSTKALFALGKLYEYADDDNPDIVLCHIYSDLLFEACGMLRKRFRTDKASSPEQRKQHENNRREYGCNESNYKMLEAAESIRNYIEHVDERNSALISMNAFRGTFNVIHRGMNEGIRDELCRTAKPLYGMLNLESMSYVGFREDKRDGHGIVEIDVDLAVLREELGTIKETADAIWSGEVQLVNRA